MVLTMILGLTVLIYHFKDNRCSTPCHVILDHSRTESGKEGQCFVAASFSAI